MEKGRYFEIIRNRPPGCSVRHALAIAVSGEVPHGGGRASERFAATVAGIPTDGRDAKDVSIDLRNLQHQPG